mmetsp:Transcript_22168/g.35268  ORF Transcript_22168/g.35268 Transcript_22168/m.35268 type:complete len:211 (-) Transcript_22168:209-841(-)
MMKTNVTILSSTSIATSIGINGDGINRSKVPLHRPKFFFVHQVKETGLKLSNLTRCRCHTHGLLSTTQQDVILCLRNDGVVHRTVRLIRLQMTQVHNIVQFGGKICRTRDKESFILIEAHSVNFLFVGVELVQFLSRYRIVQADGPIVECYKESFVEIEPHDVGGVDSLSVNLGKVNLQSGAVGIVEWILIFWHVVHGYLRIVFDEWVGD